MKNNICAIFILFCTITFGQEIKISGLVLDAESKSPIPGATIIATNNNFSKGTITDFDGNFEILAPPGTSIEVSFIGYKNFTYTGNNSDQNTILLEEESEALDEVVLIGYGSQSKKNITGAVSIVGASEISDLQPQKIEQALQGTIAGVNVSTQSGSPGAGLNIRIRGVGTNEDASPVAIIDGYVGDLGTLNPSDIETITVLKDAQAAIYGTIGANGVILITTKKGTYNTPLKVEVNSSYSLQETSRILPVLNAKEYGIILNESFIAAGRFPPVSGAGDLGEGTNWQEALFETAPMQNHNIALSGGSEKIRYAFSGSIFDQEGIIGGDKSSFQRKVIKQSIGIDLSPKVKMTSTFFYTNIGRTSISDFGLGSVLFNAINIPSTLDIYNESGALSLAPANLGIEIINPLAQLDNTYNEYQLNKLNGNFDIQYQMTDDLKFTTRLGVNTSNDKSRNFSKIVNYGGKVFDVQRSQVNQSRNNYNEYTFDAFLNYILKIKDNHTFNFTLGTSLFNTWGNNLAATGYDIPYNDWAFADISLANGLADQKTTGSYEYRDRLASYFFRLQYSFKDKAFLSGMIRRDLSTKFGASNRIGIFPSFSAGYLVSEENFLKDSKIVDLFKFRASYGLLGNDKIGSNRYRSLLSGEAAYVFDNTLTFGRAVGVIPNDAIKWEASEKFDVGIDINMFDNKINIVADYFINTRQDLLIQYVPVTGILGTTAPGAGSPTVNSGSIRNKGFELLIGYNQKVFKNIDLSLNLNATQIDNEVIAVNSNVPFIEGGGFGVGQPAPSRMEVGAPIGYFYGYKTQGIFQNNAEVTAHPSQINLGAEASPGDFRFQDTNQDGLITEADRVNLGDPIADYTFGANLNLKYKNIDFSMYWFASLGNEIVRNYERVQPYANRLSYYVERWRGEGTSNTVPRVTTAATTNNVFSDFFVEDGSFARLQNAQIGYQIPEGFTEKFGIQKMRIYASGSNLVTLTKYKGFDPAASSGAPVGGGIDNGFYPIPKIYTLGLNLTF